MSSKSFQNASKLNGIVSVLQFGAVGDGVTDDTAAIQAALNSGNGIKYLPEGVYKVSSKLSMPAGTCLVGENPFASVILTNNASGDVVETAYSNEIKNLKIDSSVTKTSGFFVNITGNGVLIENCEFQNYYIAISVGNISSPIVVDPRVFNCEFRTPNPILGSGACQFLHFSNAQFCNNVVVGYYDPSIQPDWGVRFHNGDTAFISDCNITGHGQALYVDIPSNQNCYALTVANSLFDSGQTGTSNRTFSSAALVPSGGLYNTKFSNCWFGLSKQKNGCVVEPGTYGQVNGLTFDGCEFTDNGENGLCCVSDRVKNWTVTGGHSAGNEASGIRCAAGTSYFTIVGHIASNIANRGPNNKGISLDAAAESTFVISNNIVYGNTSKSIDDASTGYDGQIFNNVGYNGSESVLGVTLGSSGSVYKCGHTPEVWYVTGGTGVSITQNSTQISSSPSTIQLGPNQEIAIFYVSAPTVLKKKQ